MLSDAWFVKMCQIAKLINEFEMGSEIRQGYIQINFFNHSFEWGDIVYRNSMDGGPDGIWEFRSLDEALSAIQSLIKRQKVATARW